MSPARETRTLRPQVGRSSSKTPCTLGCLTAPRYLDTEGLRSPAGRQVGSSLLCSLLHTLHPGLRASQEEACPRPLPREPGSAGAPGYWQLPGPPVQLVKDRRGVSSFYGPHKASLVAAVALSSPWQPVPPGPARTSFFFKEPISQTHKITRNATGGSVP